MNCISKCLFKKNSFRKRSGSNEEVIAEPKANSKEQDKLFHEKGIQMLERHRNDCITIEGDYVNKKNYVSLCHSRDFSNQP